MWPLGAASRRRIILGLSWAGATQAGDPNVQQDNNRAFQEADMNTPRRWIGAAFSTPNSFPKTVGRSASFGLLIATTAATLLCGSGAAHSGPCKSQIEELERQIGHAYSSAKSGPTAPQSIEAQLHHQPTPETVRNAERKANADAAAALQRARQADTDDNPAACAKALDEAKRRWSIPA
jgi:hypothetical protein